MQTTRKTSFNPLLCSIAVFVFGLIFFLVQFGHDGQAVITPHSESELTFDVPPRKPVIMIIHNTHRYQVTPAAVEEFSALLPLGGHLVHLGSPSSPGAHTPTLFHQMKCLGIIHAALVDVSPDSAGTPTPLVSHCLNYLRQTILCRPNLRLESVMNANASSEKEYETVCRDWEAVYAAAEKNQRAYSALYKQR